MKQIYKCSRCGRIFIDEEEPPDFSNIKEVKITIGGKEFVYSKEFLEEILKRTWEFGKEMGEFEGNICPFCRGLLVEVKEEENKG